MFLLKMYSIQRMFISTELSSLLLFLLFSFKDVKRPLPMKPTGFLRNSKESLYSTMTAQQNAILNIDSFSAFDELSCALRASPIRSAVQKFCLIHLAAFRIDIFVSSKPHKRA